MDQEIKDNFTALRSDFNEFKAEVRRGYDKLDTKIDRFLLGQNINAKEIAVIQVSQDTQDKEINDAHKKIDTNVHELDSLKTQLNRTVFKVGGVVAAIGAVTGIILKVTG